VTTDDFTSTLPDSALFRGVSTSLVASVTAGSEARLLALGEKLLSVGADNRRLYIILSGSVSVCVAADEGSSAATPSSSAAIQLGVGECVGELSILDGRPVSADVVAAEPSVVLSLDREQVWTLIDSSAEVARNLLRILAGRVRQDDAALGESSRLQRYFERIATMDGLTHLRNRRWLDDAFARQLDRSARTAQPASLLMIDVDHFKRLNDEHGHLVGDALLRRVAQIMASGLRPQDLLARYGGEEFAILLPGLDAVAGVAVAERLRTAVDAASQDEDGVTLPHMTISIGVTTSRPAESLLALMKRADEALYRAKQSGRNRTSE
jgi:diguanylate cyclase (GGDEF)-like protein